MPDEPRTAIQIMLAERRQDMFSSQLVPMTAQKRELEGAASMFWKSHLTEEEQRKYYMMAVQEQTIYDEKIAQLEAANPKLKRYRQQLASYNGAIRKIASAKSDHAAPLWRLQKKMDHKKEHLVSTELKPKKKPKKSVLRRAASLLRKKMSKSRSKEGKQDTVSLIIKDKPNEMFDEGTEPLPPTVPSSPALRSKKRRKSIIRK